MLEKNAQDEQERQVEVHGRRTQGLCSRISS